MATNHGDSCPTCHGMLKRGDKAEEEIERLKAENLRLGRHLGNVVNCRSDGTARTACGICVECQAMQHPPGSEVPQELRALSQEA